MAHDPRVERAGDRAADRGDRPDRPRGRTRSSWSMPPSRRAWSRSTCGPRRSTCSPSPATRRSTARPAPARSTSDRGPAAPGLARGGHRRRLVERDAAERCCPTSSKGARPTCWASPGLAAGDRLGRRAGPDSLRSHEVGLLQQVVDWVEEHRRLAGRRPLGPGHARRRALADRPRWADPSGSRLDPRHQLRIAVRPGLHCAPYIHRAPRDLPRRHAPAQPRPVQHRTKTSTPSSMP